MASMDSSLIALCSWPRCRPIALDRARRALASTPAASATACCARSASSPVSRSTVACASCLASAVRSFSFAPIACTFVVAASVVSRNTVRAPPAALIRPTSLPIAVTAWASRVVIFDRVDGAGTVSPRFSRQPRDRVRHLPAQRLVPQPVLELQEHHPQVGLHRDARTAEQHAEVRTERGEERLVVQPLVELLQQRRQPPNFHRQTDSHNDG